ncbi:RING finger protein 17 [Merluccius polli]|uniref:RING finger protein 17 n=1 Tax=Merluccius polli TaxID=89951 RepID=A0AA47P6I3_MERPO|nr:RING finger protein 17 [Merluccius polli]
MLKTTPSQQITAEDNTAATNNAEDNTAATNNAEDNAVATNAAEDNAVATNNTEDNNVTTNNTVPMDAGKTTDDAETTADAKPTTDNRRDFGHAEGDDTEETKPPGRDDFMDNREGDDRGLKEQGQVAPPEQCVEPTLDANRVEKLVDEALAQAAENMAHLEHIHQTLVLGQSVQAHRDKRRLRGEINEAVVQATNLLHKRQETLLEELKELEVHFPSTQVQLSRVQEMMDTMDMAMRKARQVRLHPSLELYCDLQEVLETLQAPVIRESFDVSVTMGSGLSCVLQTDSLSDCLTASLKLNIGSPKPLLKEQATRPLPRRRCSTPKSEARRRTPVEMEVRGGASASAEKEVLGQHKRVKEVLGQHKRGKEEQATPPGMVRSREEQGRLVVNSGRSEPAACLNPRTRTLTPVKPPAPRRLIPDVIIENLIEEEEEEEEEEQRCEVGSESFLNGTTAPPPTGPELANDKRRAQKKRTLSAIAPLVQGTAPAPPPVSSRFQWVQVTHVLNPNHFYVHYVAENKKAAMLSQKVNQLTSRPSSFFISSDTLETGSQVFVKEKDHLWCRGTVLYLSQKGQDNVTSCPAHLLTCARIFLMDYGITKTISLESEPVEGKYKMVVMKEHLRKMDDVMKMELSGMTPLAVRCSLKDLVPADLRRGWGQEAQKELRRVVGSAVVEMQLFSREKDVLLVDLRKPPMDPASTCPVSVREYLVFIELARFYSPLTNSDTLLFYPPVRPRSQSEQNAMVTHVNTPQDFYIQLVGSMEHQLLSSKLQRCYGSVSQAGGDAGLQLYCPALLQPCVARYHDNLWYRARITGMLAARSVEVQFVDMGNKKVVSVSELRKIKDEFFSLPAMAIQCCLADVAPADGFTWSQVCSDRFSSLVLHKLVTILARGEMRSQKLEVQVLEGGLQGPQVDLARLLVSEHLARYRDRPAGPQSHSEPTVWDPPFDCKERSVEPRPQPPVSQDTEPRPQLQLPTVRENIRVKVTHVTSPGSFYVQLLQNDTQLKWVSERVQECAQDCELQDVVWKENMFCCALVNGVWERGRILADVSSNNIAEVRRCDSGSKAKLHVSSLRPLQPTLEGSLALECRLADIRPAGGATWTATASDCFSHYLTGARALMNIKELTEERPLSVNLLCPNRAGQEVNLADFLASKGLALKERKPREALKPRAAAEHEGGGDTHYKCTTTSHPKSPPSPAPPCSPPSSAPPCSPPSPAPPCSPPSPAPPCSPPSSAPPCSPPSSAPPCSPPSPAPPCSPPSPAPPCSPPSSAPPCSPPSSAPPCSPPSSAPPCSPPSSAPPCSPPSSAPPCSPPSPAPPCTPPADPPPKPAHRTHLPTEKVTTELYRAPDLPGPGHTRMRVSAVGEDGHIYLQTRHAESQLEVLRKRIQGQMKMAPQQKPYTWQTVLGCALMGPDMLWYRAQVLEVLRELVKVRYVDYGSVENIPVVHVYPTLLCEEVPTLCFPCHLNAVIPVSHHRYVLYT